MPAKSTGTRKRRIVALGGSPKVKTVKAKPATQKTVAKSSPAKKTVRQIQGSPKVKTARVAMAKRRR